MHPAVSKRWLRCKIVVTASSSWHTISGTSRPPPQRPHAPVIRDVGRAAKLIVWHLKLAPAELVEREHRRRGARGDAGEWRERHPAATGHQEPAARREADAELWLEAAFCFERRGPRAAALRPLASQVGRMSIERPNVGQRATTFGRSGRDTFPSILDRAHGRTCVWTRACAWIGVRVRRASVKHARRTFVGFALPLKVARAP